MRSTRFGFVLALLTSFLAVEARAGLLVNGDFETGDFTGWTNYTTVNGAQFVGFPTVTSFDTTGSGASNAAEFRVGRISAPAGSGGAGISQSFTAGAGTYVLSADIAVLGGPLNNGEGGTFSLFFDGLVVDSFVTGPVTANSVTRHSLGATLNGVAAGSHDIRIEIVRQFSVSGNVPFQFVDNVSVIAPASVATPEPSTLLCGAVGAAFALSRLARRRRAA